VRFLPVILAAVALALGGFSYWGLNTAAGRRAFDEMAGIIPLVAGPVGLCFLAGAIAAHWRNRRARKKMLAVLSNKE
jgi:hypothetical protein